MSARLKTWKGGLGKKKRTRIEVKDKLYHEPNFFPELKFLERENNHVLKMMYDHVSLS